MKQQIKIILKKRKSSKTLINSKYEYDDIFKIKILINYLYFRNNLY